MTGQHTGHTPIRGNKEMHPIGQEPLPGPTSRSRSCCSDAGYATGAFGKWGLGGPGTRGRRHPAGLRRVLRLRSTSSARTSTTRSSSTAATTRPLPGNGPAPSANTVGARGGRSSAARLQPRRDRGRGARLHRRDTGTSLSSSTCRSPSRTPSCRRPRTRSRRTWTRAAGASSPRRRFPGAHYGPQPMPRAAYAAMVSRMDRDVGRVLDRLRELGLDDNTHRLLHQRQRPAASRVAATPSSSTATARCAGIKRDVYEGGIRVPMIACWPGRVPAGARATRLGACGTCCPRSPRSPARARPPTSTGSAWRARSSAGARRPAPVPLLGVPRAGWEAGRTPGQLEGGAPERRSRTRGRWSSTTSRPTPASERNIAAAHPDIVREMERIMAREHTPSWLFPTLTSEVTPSRRSRSAGGARRGVRAAPRARRGRAPQHRPHLRRRPRLRRRRLLRRQAQSRRRTSTGWRQGGAAVHRRRTPPSATCTPSRYALLTGEYAWRQRGHRHPAGRRGADHRARPDRRSRRSCEGAGYRTGVVGKWHLGLGEGEIDWNGEIKPGPARDRLRRRPSSWPPPATACRASTCEDRRVVGLDPADPIQVSYGKPIAGEPTGKANPELLKVQPSHGHDMTIVNGISRIGYMKGGKAALVEGRGHGRRLHRPGGRVRRAEQATGRSSSTSPLHDIHVPRVPHPRFAGKTGARPARRRDRPGSTGASARCSTRSTGSKLPENTLVIFTSDNGPVVDDGYQDDAVKKLGDHKPAGPLRGGKYSKFEAGTRVPFIVRWPGRVKPGRERRDRQSRWISPRRSRRCGAATGRGRRARQPATCCPRSSASRPAAATTSSCTPTAWPCHRGRWKYIEPGTPARR